MTVIDDYNNSREPIQIVEIDVDYCTLTYGTGLCTAVLGTTGVRKCFNTFGTCQVATAFTKTVKTIRFVNNVSKTPVGAVYFPALEKDGVSAFSSSVNIAGADDKMGAFGRRATVKADLSDFVSDDIFLDKYQKGRVSGTAQTNEGGYNPLDRGTFFTKLRARWPHYAGRPLRIIDGYMVGNALVDTKTRHYIITDMVGPDERGKFTIEGKDVLALADDKKALVPKPSLGKLSADVTVDVGQTFSLTPAGIEVEYPTSGFATIGSEIVAFTRSGAVVTLTARGQRGSLVAAHSTKDTFQIAYDLNNVRIDDFLNDILVNYAKIDPAFVPLVSEWEPEITRWLSSTLLKTVITKPTGVSQLIGELAILGISVWWDDIQQKIKLLANHPVADEALVPISDRNNIIKINQQDNDDLRLTQVHFYTKQADPTKDYKDKSNYDQINVLVDTEAESVNAYNDTKIREIFCRWFNDGGDSIVRTLSLRLLKRFNTPPIHYKITLDAKDRAVVLTDVIDLDSRVVTDVTGNPVSALMQIISRTEDKTGHRVTVVAQAFQYNGRYGFVTQNGVSNYGSATDTQKRVGAYFVGPTLLFPDSQPPYAFI